MNFLMYTLLHTIVTIKDETLFIDFSDFPVVINAFEVLEICSFALQASEWKNIKNIIIDGSDEIKKYLEEISFLHTLHYVLWIKSTSYTYQSNNDPLRGIKVFFNKNEFYWINQQILNVFTQIWLSEETSYLVLSSLWEVIDNSFFHNLWRWQTSLWPLCMFMAQNDTKKRKLSFVIDDLWVWLSNTLKDNYPWLKTDAEYIEIALKPWVTGRYQNKWWNWLVYLQKNIFNGFKWELVIRSNNSLVKVQDFWKIQEIDSEIAMTGTCIYFSLFY